MSHVRSGCLHRADVSQFSRTCFGHLFRIFPLVSFLLHFFLVHFHPRVCLSFKLPFSILHSLVSPSFSRFFSCSSVVDYSAVRVGCPLIVFLFARLGCLLESVEEECLKWVSLFMGEDYPHKFVRSSLFPLVSNSTKVARLLKMSEVRSSDLETGLSSSDDHVISEAASYSMYCAFMTI